MQNGDFNSFDGLNWRGVRRARAADERDEHVAAEQAARRAIENDAEDWQGYADLALALIAQKWAPDAVVRRRVQEAVVAARRAVALAPDEPGAHLALADALLAVTPRRTRTRAAALGEID